MNTQLLEKVLAAIPEKEKQEAFKKQVNALAAEIPHLESTMPAITTKNGYGAYLQLATSKVAILALLCAGANSQGVLGAAKINGINI